MQNTRRRLLRLMAGAIPAFATGHALADTYPSRPIRMIVPWPPGSIVDIAGRLVAERLRQALGQPVVVDNRPGASGMIGLSLGAQAKPDGYTLTFASSSNLVIAPALEMRAPYDALKDFQPVSQYTQSPMVLLVNPTLAARDVRELIALARAQPGKLAYGSNGTGGVIHITAELFKHAAGIDLLHVPFKGSPQTQLALLGNEVQVSFDFPAVCAQQVKAGRMRALLVTSAKRVPVLPEVPTALEVGMPDLILEGWAGFVAPRGTPAEIVTRLQTEIARIVHAPEVREQLEQNGQVAVGSSPEEFRVFIAEEKAKWTRIIQLTGVKLGQ
jgi:tripartite-type tricarboxylate transporter receptor subunit TctC